MNGENPYTFDYIVIMTGYLFTEKIDICVNSLHNLDHWVLSVTLLSVTISSKRTAY